MNFIDKLFDDLLITICNFLDEKELYKFAHTYKMRGSNNIERLLKYCEENHDDYYDIEDCCEDCFYSCKCGDAGQLKKFKKIINFDNTNIPILSKYFKLRFFSKEIKQNKKYVLEFIKNDPHNIRYADIIFIYDRQIVLLVINEYPEIYHDLPEELCNDINIKNSYKNKKKQYCHSPLPRDYYLDKRLIDNKYCKMRKIREEYDEQQRRIYEQEKEERRINEQKIEKIKEEYRKENNLSPDYILYTNSYGEVIGQQEYLDDYYSNHHYYIDGYE